MIDQAQLAFNPTNLMILNIVLGIVMFGVALELSVDDFRRVLRSPKPFVIGLLAQFVLLPAATFLIIMVGNPYPSVALGMLLVASCPGGNISNFITHFAGGTTALSVSMSAVSTMFATLLTPLNFSFWAGMYPPTAELLREVAISPAQMALTVFLLLGLPLALGMAVQSRFTEFANKLVKPMKIFSLIVFAGFIFGALAANWQAFIDFVTVVAGWVLLHNAIALATGFSAAKIGGLPDRDRRAVMVEVGIQNSGLGLALIFNYFDGLGGMAVVAAFWGMWHIVAGLTVAKVFRMRDAAHS